MLARQALDLLPRPRLARHQRIHGGVEHVAHALGIGSADGVQEDGIGRHLQIYKHPQCGAGDPTIRNYRESV